MKLLTGHVLLQNQLHVVENVAGSYHVKTIHVRGIATKSKMLQMIGKVEAIAENVNLNAQSQDQKVAIILV